MAIIVFAALTGSGGLKAGTPFEIASVPVSATAPKAKARRIRKMDSTSNPSGGVSTTGVGNDAAGSPEATATRPMAMMASAPTT